MVRSLSIAKAPEQLRHRDRLTMTVVVADSSLVNYLVLIGSIEILRELFNRVLVPDEVIMELGAAFVARHRRTSSVMFGTDPRKCGLSARDVSSWSGDAPGLTRVTPNGAAPSGALR